MQQESKPICVVIDTNTWISDSNLFLKTPLGAALLYILKRSNGYIGLPELIEDEVIKHTIRVGREAIQKINSNFKKIEIILGSRSTYELPNENQLESVARERFIELDHLIIKIPFSFEQAKAAVKRINECSQPNGEKNQQFKDSVIWEAILTLVNDYTVHFITQDNAFYKNRRADSGYLAENLLNDCQNLGSFVHIYQDIKSCLKQLQHSLPPLDYQSIILAIDSVINPNLQRQVVAEIGFEIVSLASELSTISAFITEMIGKLALSFEINYYLSDVHNTDDNERKNALLRVGGDCLYEFNSNSISDVKMDFERMTWLEPSGELGKRGIVYMSATLGGDNQAKYMFREPLSNN
ncbi:PIN domain-containing protein [Nostoc sp. ChiQUE01b]|uniref:PIN domain-containing protein n=1 Tax=Nostoc sp. ChiQUE01b TaxID=3075376 RepID=UPI002AD3B2C0|nr:PIN domain-containing protein [Nostoc sp. ChiQUE01b]MDZ8258174.1 PIN domain-containing protein [Nostoc sp. ChiQUE01b]